MKPVFADTAFFLALINSRDQHHQRAAELNANLESPLITTSWVLLELANALSASRSRARFEQVLTRLRAEPNVEIVAPDADLFERGCNLYIARPDKEWSLTDCISFVVMRERGLTAALTADRHFEQAGFHALLDFVMSCTVPSGIKAPLTTVESALVLKIIGADSSTLDTHTCAVGWEIRLILKPCPAPLQKRVPLQRCGIT